MNVRAVKQELLRSFDLNGRTARAPYLTFLLTAVVSYAAIISLGVVYLQESQIVTTIYIITAVYYLPVTAAGVRRLHDIGESGKLMLDPLKPAAALGGFLLLLQLWVFNSNTGSFIAIIAALFLGRVLIALLAIATVATATLSMMYFSHTMGLLLLPSQPGTNKYGPNPLEVPS